MSQRTGQQTALNGKTAQPASGQAGDKSNNNLIHRILYLLCFKQLLIYL